LNPPTSDLINAYNERTLEENFDMLDPALYKNIPPFKRLEVKYSLIIPSPKYVCFLLNLLRDSLTAFHCED